MKICLIGDGNSIHIRRWSDWLRLKGHEVQMISLTELTHQYSDFDKCYVVPGKSGLFGYIQKVPAIRRLVKAWKPDIVHGHYLTGGGFYAAMSGGNKVVVSAWGSDLYKDMDDLLKSICVKYALHHSDLVMADSIHMIETINELAPDAKAVEVLFGIDTEKFKPNPVIHDEFRFLSIRPTAPIYNPMIIVLAFEKADLDAVLWLYKPSVGCEGVYDYVKSKPELSEKVTWICKMPYDDMPFMYNAVDCGISIPETDGASTAMLECMACEVPVIVGNIPQKKEWITDQYTGFLTKIDVHHLANKMALVMNTKLALVGTRARVCVRHRAEYEEQMRKAEGLYLDLLQ